MADHDAEDRATMQKHGISKTKVAMVIAILLPCIEQVSDAVGHPIKFPQELKDGLIAVGLWSLKDGLDGTKTNISTEIKNN